MESVMNLSSSVYALMLMILIGTNIYANEERQLSQLLFLRTLWCTVLFVFSDIIWNIYIYVGANSSEAAWIINISYFFVSAFIGYYWFQYSEVVQDPSLNINRKYQMMCAVPTLMVVILSISAPYNHLLFYIQDCQYVRGPLYFVHPISMYLLPFCSAVRAIIRSRSAVTLDQKMLYITLSSFMVAPFIGMILQIVFPYLPSVDMGLSFSAVMIYIKTKNRQVSIDPLTKLNNRLQMENYLAEKINDFYDRNRPLKLAILDGDSFKEINDTYGHVEGDAALVKIANAMRRSVRNTNIFIGRFGGDEFIMAYSGDETDVFEQAIQDVQKNLDEMCIDTPYQLKVSVGMTEFKDGFKNSARLLEAADAMLYEEKRRKKVGRNK